MRRWHAIFVTDQIQRVIRTFRQNGLEVQYNRAIESSAGHLGSAAKIMNCSFYYKNEQEKIRLKTGRNPKTMIELRSGSPRFEKILVVIREKLDIVYDEYAVFSEEKEEIISSAI
jgi:hypothetical protein